MIVFFEIDVEFLVGKNGKRSQLKRGLANLMPVGKSQSTKISESECFTIEFNLKWLMLREHDLL